MTSSDVLDTCLAMQLKEAADLLLADLDALLAVLKRPRLRAQDDDLRRAQPRQSMRSPPPSASSSPASMPSSRATRERLALARRDIATCAISGAIGTFANIDPAVEAQCRREARPRGRADLDQVIPRDRHAWFSRHSASSPAAVERLATEIRHLQRTEVREAEEYFAPGQKGSSAMPHKRNPVLSENLTGLARIVRAAVTPALREHRPLAPSATSRIPRSSGSSAPDATIALDFRLARLTGLVDKLVV